MKRFLFIFLFFFLLGSQSLQAAPVSANQALDIAQRIFSAQSTRKSGAPKLKIVWDGEDVATKAEQPAFYVVARDGGGFVIVAGDDNVTPILAISDRNEFKVEEMPENVKWWMARMKEYVRSTTDQTPAVKERWANLAGTKDGAAITGTVNVTHEHLTPEWGQRGLYKGIRIYNSKCPMVDTAYTLTGCVATAIGEVMTTLSGIYPSVMPTAGTGTVPPYDNVESGCVSASTKEHPYVLGTTYLWSQLRNLDNPDAIKSTINGGTDEGLALIDNMNQLLADLGAVMHSSYSENSTSAYTSQIPDSIAKYYPGFNKAAYFDEASDYTGQQWGAKLKEQLAVRPIIYSGRTKDSKSGHAFVFDAYGTYGGVDVFHVNFGWNGICNGYFYEYDLDSDGTPKYNFSWKCGAVFDFYPVSDPEHPQYPVMLEASYKNESYPGVRCVREGSAYIVYYSIVNNGRLPYGGKIKFAINDLDHVIAGSEFDFSTDSIQYTQIASGSVGSLSIGSISFGDKVVCYYQDGADWKLLPGPISTTISEWPLTPAAFIKTEDSYTQNDWFDFVLMNNDYIYNGTTWTITDPDGDSVVKNQADRGFQFAKTGKYKIKAATAKSVNGTVLENLVTIITVGSPSSSSSNR